MEQTIRTATYTNKIGDTTFIIRSKYTGTKTLADAFEEIIVSAFRRQYNEHDDSAENSIRDD